MGKIFTLGMAGCGSVGQGVLELLAENRDWIQRRTGKRIRIKTVVKRSPDKKELIEAAGAVFSTNLQDLVTDPEIDAVLELMGGMDAAKTLIRDALEAGKDVITANKALLAEDGDDLFQLAADKKLHLGYEAAVAGGIPIVTTIRESLAANKAHAIVGILNGTSNFILTQMSDDSREPMDFATALKLAQDQGYAEADPSLDVNGGDAGHKLALLIRLAFGVRYPFDQLRRTGIDVVTPVDIAFAKEFGYVIKLLAHARLHEGKVEAGVFPALAPQSYLLASVNGPYNAVRYEGNAGPVTLYGYGAGGLPTASAVLADVAMAATHRTARNTGFAEKDQPPAELLDLDDAVTKHYLRITVPDKPGVMHFVSGILAKYEISLAQVIQQGEDEGQGVPIVFLTHRCTARAIHAAMKDIDAGGMTLARTMHYRIM